jgi:hypothetical protein
MGRAGERGNLFRLIRVLSASSPRPSPPLVVEEREKKDGDVLLFKFNV